MVLKLVCITKLVIVYRNWKLNAFLFTMPNVNSVASTKVKKLGKLHCHPKSQNYSYILHYDGHDVHRVPPAQCPVNNHIPWYRTVS